MTRNSLQKAAVLLARHYGPQPRPGPPGEWPTLVRLVLGHGRAGKESRDWAWVTEAPLNTASETAEQTASRLAEILEAAGYPASKAGALHALAAWWQRRVGETDAGTAFRQRP